MSRLAGAIMNSAVAPETALVACASVKAPAKGKVESKAKQLTRMRSRIDLDDDVEQAKQEAKDAKKQLRKKMTDAKLARKRKMRLVTKASKLPSEDLYRIALYKRVNLMNAMVSKDMAGAVTSMLGQVDQDVLETLLKEQLEKRGKVQQLEMPEGNANSAAANAGGAGGQFAGDQASSEVTMEREVEEKSPASVDDAEDPE